MEWKQTGNRLTAQWDIIDFEIRPDATGFIASVRYYGNKAFVRATDSIEQGKFLLETWMIQYSAGLNRITGQRHRGRR